MHVRYLLLPSSSAANLLFQVREHFAPVLPPFFPPTPQHSAKFALVSSSHTEVPDTLLTWIQERDIKRDVERRRMRIVSKAVKKAGGGFGGLVFFPPTAVKKFCFGTNS